MSDWTNKQWGALIGALVVFLIALIGFGATAVVILVGIAGYFVGKYLDGEIDLEDVRDRAQDRAQDRARGRVRADDPGVARERGRIR